MNNRKEVKEEFCPSCLVVPLALAGAGAAAAGGTVSKKHKIWKKALLISGILTLIIALGFGVYMFMNKDCASCKLK